MNWDVEANAHSVGMSELTRRSLPGAQLTEPGIIIDNGQPICHSQDLVPYMHLVTVLKNPSVHVCARPRESISCSLLRDTRWLEDQTPLGVVGDHDATESRVKQVVTPPPPRLTISACACP